MKSYLRQAMWCILLELIFFLGGGVGGSGGGVPYVTSIVSFL